MKSNLLALALVAAAPAAAVEFHELPCGSTHATVAFVDPSKEHLRLFLDDDSGAPFRRFDALASWLGKRHQTLEFAMNAGMFEADRSPVGLFVADGRTQGRLNTADGDGNFFLKPNGVFYLGKNGSAAIAETSRFAALAEPATLATQSGPLLVQDGAIHHAFDPHSSSRLVRNGVGITADGKVVFAVSEGPVSFHEFATLFRDRLHCRNALYFDGVVSSLYAPALKRDDVRADLGPMVGVVK